MVVPLLAWHVHLLLPLHLAGHSDSTLLLSIILSLVALPMLLAWLFVRQYFIKPIQVADLYSIKEDYSTASSYLKDSKEI